MRALLGPDFLAVSPDGSLAKSCMKYTSLLVRSVSVCLLSSYILYILYLGRAI